MREVNSVKGRKPDDGKERSQASAQVLNDGFAFLGDSSLPTAAAAV